MTIQQPNSDKQAPSSTQTMLAKLTPADATHELTASVLRLMIADEPTKIASLKSMILNLITLQGANVLTLWKGKSLLQTLLEYYQTRHEKDHLSNLLGCVYRSQLFMTLCYQIFQMRTSDKPAFRSNFIYPTTQRSRNYHYLNMIYLTCESMDEAVFYAVTLENFLYTHLGIPYRSSTKYFPIRIDPNKEDAGKVNVRFVYRPEDYYKWNPQVSSLNLEELISPEFKNPSLDYYDFCNTIYHLKHSTRGLLQSSQTAMRSLDVEKIIMHALSCPFPSRANEFSAKLLVITRTGLGYGNFTNARLALEGLCKKMPKIHIDWILANDGDPLPTMQTSLPPQVVVHETDALWKLYPLIRSLSVDADIVLGLPNNFLKFEENNLAGMPLTLSPNSILLEVSEYNHVYEEETLDPNCVQLTSGINPPGPSMGILKPNPLTLPVDLDKKRELLCEDPKAMQIFRDHPTAPLYFAYGYQPVKELSSTADILGLNIRDVLALFVQHAKSHDQKQIKVVLPIRGDTLQDVFHTFPQVFSNCVVQFSDSKGVTTVLNTTKPSDKHTLQIEIFNLFPFNNTTFRSLMDYAATTNTPIVTTGDQSFFELFFTIPQGFVFMYQLLEHKKPLLDQIKTIMTTEQLSASLTLITMTEQGIQSEHALFNLVDFLNVHETQLKQESLKLSSIIQSQPELTESLVKVIVDCVEKKRALLDEEIQHNPALSK